MTNSQNTGQSSINMHQSCDYWVAVKQSEKEIAIRNVWRMADNRIVSSYIMIYDMANNYGIES